MFNIFKKHKFFLVLLLALITLAVGMIFVAPSKQTQESEAGEYNFYFNFSAKWNNGNGTVSTGNYTSQDGHVLEGSVGSVSVSWDSSKGGSWSGSTYVDTLSGDASCRFKSTCTVWELQKKIDCSLSRSATSASGFSASISTDGTVGVSGKYGALVWDSSSGYYHCVFSPRTYSISFNANGGAFENEETKDVDTVFYESYNLPSANPTKKGYTFAGWYTGATDGDKVDGDTCFSNVATRTLYAHWTANVYNVSFDRMGGSGGTTSLDVVYDQTPLDISVPTKKGYTFLGYFTGSEGGTQYFDDSGKATRVWDMDCNAVFYACWQANIYVATIDTGGAEIVNANGWTESGNTLSKEIVFDTKYGSLPQLAKDGFTFNGYKLGSSIIDENTVMQTDSDYSLDVDWIEHAYSIKFDANGGSGTMNSLTEIKYTDKQELPSCNFEKENFLFKGWALESEGEVRFLENATIEKLTEENNKEIIFYAIWEETWAVSAVKPSGKGTLSSPYLIASAENLAWLSSLTNNNLGLEGVYKQTANIDLAGKTWLPIGNSIARKFIGQYNGNNFSIRNLETSQTKKANGEYLYSFAGLFGNASVGTLKNINILSGTIYGNTYVGGIVGYATSALKITACQTYVDVYANAKAGGIVGYLSNSTIENSFSTAKVYGNGEVGGIAGNINVSTVNNCGFEGSVSGQSNVGLLIGYANSGTAQDCYANVSTSGNFCNGSLTISNCLYTAGSDKKYFKGDFSNWTISPLGKPLPSGLLWIAIGGEKILGVEQIEELGYTQV